MKRRQILQSVGSAGIVANAGCLGSLQAGSPDDGTETSQDDKQESRKWGLRSCGSTDMPIHAQAAEMDVEKSSGNVQRPYDTTVKVVLKNTDVDNRVVEVRATAYADGQSLSPHLFSDPYIVDGGDTGQFSPSLGFESSPTEFELLVRSMPKEEYDDASSGTWLEQDNSACF